MAPRWLHHPPTRGTSNSFNPTILHDPRRMMARVTDLSTLPTFDDISAASSRIADGIFHTPCFEAPALSERCGCTVFTLSLIHI